MIKEHAFAAQAALQPLIRRERKVLISGHWQEVRETSIFSAIDPSTATAFAAFRHAGTRVVDADGKSVLPGMNESHIHIFCGSAELDQLSLYGVQGFEALHEKVLRGGSVWLNGMARLLDAGVPGLE